ncbi:hypothetical protein ABMC89_03290 [Sulfitobacter sp. HNIBRBA3233]|uniref:hypothetical protein n=1 Tax=Sulfitobacter marinivivus TaxID=3158558 RepID=UPI0032E03C8A
MRASHWLACALGAMLPLAVSAQDRIDGPLSVIDWLDAPQPLAQLPRAPETSPRNRTADEPAVAATGTAPQVIVRPLDARTSLTVGLVPASVTGMKPDLWSGSDVADVVELIGDLPESDLPAANALLFTLLLAEASAPQGQADAQDALTLARAQKLMALGAVDPALSLLEQGGAARAPALFDLWAQLSLLVGTEDTPCGELSRNPRMTQDIGLRIFCDARNGAWDNAALAFGSAKALSLLPVDELNVLDRFLNPDLFEDAPPLRAPRQPDPLTFRLYETIGESLPTGPLPRAFAVADLRDITGWKSQIQAAERLTRAGALPDNRLLGLYTDRKPAASGGIWDRVRAVQRLDAALDDSLPEKVSEALPPAWDAMREAGLDVSFSSAFYPRLADLALDDRASRVQLHMGLLSPEYELAARRPQISDTADMPFTLAAAVARGETPVSAPRDPLPRAIFDAFSSPEADPELMEMAAQKRLGEALLRAIDQLHTGARGDSLALRQALGTLRALGLEDTARRASLQILLTERER